MVQSNQVSHYAGLKQDGTVELVSSDDIFDTKIARLSTSSSTFTLAATVDNHTLVAGEYNNASPLYVDGTSNKSLNNGTAAAHIAALGANSLTGLVLGSNTINLVTILNDQNDELLNEDGAEVKGLLQTNKTDGVIPSDSELQLSFVVYDDDSSAFVAYSLPAGTYSYSEVSVISLAYASKLGVLGSLISGGLGALSREEILNLMALSNRKNYINFKLTGNYELPDAVIKIGNDAATVTLKDSADTDIPATATQDVLKAFIQTVAGPTGLAHIDGALVFVNGVQVPVRKASYSSSTELSVTLDSTITSTTLYQDTEIELVY